MRRRILGSAVVGLTIVGLFAQSKAPRKEGVEGAWQLVERIDETGKNPNPDAAAIRIFTGKHYTWFQINQKNRPALSSLANASDADKLAFLSSSNAQVGTYEIKGNELLCHPLMATGPFNAGFWAAFDIKIEGNTLTVKQTRDANGPRAGSTAKYRRIE